MGTATDYEYDGPRTSILMERDFAAEPCAVFDAWRTPETASRWLFSTEASVTEHGRRGWTRSTPATRCPILVTLGCSRRWSRNLEHSGHRYN